MELDQFANKAHIVHFRIQLRASTLSQQEPELTKQCLPTRATTKVDQIRNNARPRAVGAAQTRTRARKGVCYLRIPPVGALKSL